MRVWAGCCHFSSTREPTACIDNTGKNTPNPFVEICCFIIPRLTSLNLKSAGIELTRAPYGAAV